MYKFSFVVLHYLLKEETINCVNSILKLNGYDVSVVIVDNASGNQSGEEIKEYYKLIQNVFIIQNENNLGFSKGNNIGFRFAKYELKADFIILSNNDILLQDSENMLNKISENYQKYDFGVLGTHITNLNKEEQNQNPNFDVMKSTSEMRRSVSRTLLWYRIAIFLSYFEGDQLFFLVKDYLKKVVEKKHPKVLYDKQMFNVGLHGCFWVFSPKYIDMFNGIEEVTFMYFEEWLLFNRCREAGLLMMFDGDIDIIHVGNASSNRVCKKPRDSRKLRYLRICDSAVNIKKYIDNKA